MNFLQTKLLLNPVNNSMIFIMVSYSNYTIFRSGGTISIILPPTYPTRLTNSPDSPFSVNDVSHHISLGQVHFVRDSQTVRAILDDPVLVYHRHHMQFPPNNYGFHSEWENWIEDVVLLTEAEHDIIMSDPYSLGVVPDWKGSRLIGGFCCQGNHRFIFSSGRRQDI
jgi:hypothetical protein